VVKFICCWVIPGPKMRVPVAWRCYGHRVSDNFEPLATPLSPPVPCVRSCSTSPGRARRGPPSALVVPAQRYHKECQHPLVNSPAPECITICIGIEQGSCINLGDLRGP
jgi:hypothetical protein